MTGTKIVLVTGATGKTGRHVVDGLRRAGVGVRALTRTPDQADLDDGVEWAVGDLTRPESVAADQVRQIGDAVGRTLRIEEEPIEETRRWMITAFGDPAAVERSITYWSSLVDTPERVSDDVTKVTGRPARAFREWASDHADVFSRR